MLHQENINKNKIKTLHEIETRALLKSEGHCTPSSLTITFAHCLRNVCLSKKKIGSGLIFRVFPSVACFLIGKDEEYEKKRKNAPEVLSVKLVFITS